MLKQTCRVCDYVTEAADEDATEIIPYKLADVEFCENCVAQFLRSRVRPYRFDSVNE